MKCVLIKDELNYEVFPPLLFPGVVYYKGLYMSYMCVQIFLIATFLDVKMLFWDLRKILMYILGLVHVFLKDK